MFITKHANEFKSPRGIKEGVLVGLAMVVFDMLAVALSVDVSS